MTTPMTTIERILARASGSQAVRPGDVAVCDVDMTVLIDLQFAMERLDDVVAVADEDRLAIIMDHAVPAPTQHDASSGIRARAFARTHGIERFFDIGRHGIVHQVLDEQGLALPGQVVACTDSHTCAAGSVNAAARGLGPAEILQIVCTGKTWHRVPETVRYEAVGQLAEDVSGKDVFLHVAGRWGDATDQALEFDGPGLATLHMADRRTIATQAAEVGADFCLFPADEVCLAHLERTAPGATFQSAASDADADFADVRTLDLSAIRPTVGLPGSVIENTADVVDVAGVAIDQAFVGSCANGQLGDLEIAARIVAGQRVADGVRFIVTPASQRVYADAVRRGYVEALVEAGAVVTNPTCGACFGYHMGVVGPGEVCLTASTRNFKGRMGSPDAQIYMASTATVATSALTGRITSPAAGATPQVAA